MAYYEAKGTLSDAIGDDDTQRLLLPVPTDGNDYIIVYRLAGTFVGTIQAQDDQSGAFVAVDSFLLGEVAAAAADPTAVGNFSAPVTSGADYARIVFSAHTSGAANVEAALVPVSA